MDAEENVFIEKTLEFLRKQDSENAKILETEFAKVVDVANMANNFPSLLAEASKRARLARPQNLVDILCQVDAGMSSLNLPIRAVMGDAFIKAKVQLFQSFYQILLQYEDVAPEGLVTAAEREMSQSIYTRLLSEILWDLIRNQEVVLDIRQRAAMELVRLWEQPDQLEVDDIFPVLESTWRARNRINVNYGSLVGVSEFFQLVSQDCPTTFYSFFTRQDVSPEEKEAFQEFLFGLPQEELQKLRDAMQEKGINAIDRKFADDILKTSTTKQSIQMQEKTPEAFYASYRRRQRASQLRRLVGAPGSHTTAEAYLIMYLLKNPSST